VVAHHDRRARRTPMFVGLFAATFVVILTLLWLIGLKK
jgi:hypothetical protein